MPTNKILVGVDGSAHNEQVLSKAASLAKDEATKVILVHAISPHALSEQELAYAQERCGDKFAERMLGTGLPPFPIEENTERRSVYQFMEARELFNQVYAEDILERAENYLRDRGVDDIKTVIKSDKPANAILDVAKAEDVDMIVIGRRSHNLLVDFFLGGTAQKVLQQANRTVMAVE